jgi:hypothetical protein
MRAFGFIPRIRGLGADYVYDPSTTDYETASGLAGSGANVITVQDANANAAVNAEIDQIIAEDTSWSQELKTTGQDSSGNWAATFIDSLWKNTGQAAVTALVNKGIYGNPVAQTKTSSGAQVPVYNVNGKLATLAPDGSLQYLPAGANIPGVSSGSSNTVYWIAGIAGAAILAFVLMRK